MNEIIFKSDNHFRFENGRKTNTLNYGANRAIKLIKNNDYWLISIIILGDGISSFGDKIQMSPKKILLKNSTKHNYYFQGIIGNSIEDDFSDYEFEVQTDKDNNILWVKLILTDRNVEILYFKDEDKYRIGENFTLAKIQFFEKTHNLYITSLKIDMGLPMLSNGSYMFNEPNGLDYYIFNCDYHILEPNKFILISDSFIEVKSIQQKRLYFYAGEFELEQIGFIRGITFE